MPHQHRVSMSTFAGGINLDSRMVDTQARGHEQMMLMWQHSVEFISFASFLDSRQTCLLVSWSEQAGLAALKQTCKADQPNTMFLSMLCTLTALLHVQPEACSSLHRAA